MPSNEEIPPAQKARTIAHMNKDHRRNMRHILQHFGSVPPAPSLPAEDEQDAPDSDSDPLMVDIALTHFTVSLPHFNNAATEYCIAFNPPLASWDERRPRLVEMTRAACAALGIQDPESPGSEAKSGGGGDGGRKAVVVVVNEYMPPRIPVDITIFSSVLFYYACFIAVQLGYFAPGTPASRIVEEVVRFPYGPAGFTWLVRAIFVPVLAIHVAETWWLERSRLRRFGVRRGRKVWWLWMGSVFIEGGMASLRPRANMARPPKKKQNPVHAAISSWLDTLPLPLLESLANQLNTDPADAKKFLVERAPKRWVVYEPMVLLPSGSFTSHPWPALLECATPSQKEALWIGILQHLSRGNSKPALTHLAINEGIPLHLNNVTPSQSACEPAQRRTEQDTENLLRAPTALQPLHGSFGPDPPTTTTSSSSSRPTQEDFRSALWVSTTQNGIVQTWVPRHTMFSRGNIKEKARLLSFHHHHQHSPSSPSPPPPSPSPSSSSSPAARRARKGGEKDALRGKWAVDLYAGIGYFAFSYARLGMRVLCWELNPWSVEGLRRGAEANGFSVRVVAPPPPQSGTEWEGGGGRGGGGESEVDDLAEVLGGGSQIVVFLEDNRHAAGRVREARERIVGPARLEVVHVNCGFLPSSQGVWRDAWEIMQTGGCGAGWLHLHENVGVGDIEGRREQIQALFDRWKREGGDGGAGDAKVEHVELVKTYAPGVWHCVFDVFIKKD
ncbi:S-adenosyl-L-methionine-dependent methyltransferase [Chaetomium strumarium]|uniref:S-adenosyl-L-methionine-dependent methyltransferase n=1 Tax=Chaetomium strumarium TaxID=1170767 RepID=A0AAJ0M047_9PEZI|nr:S-adenosyl-L-methionine-dependent methyltransferase [Chaetomium strumarium]